MYPPHYAGIDSIETHGNEEAGLEYMEEITEEIEENMCFGGEEDDDPPEVTEDEHMALDEEAKSKEIERTGKKASR